MPRSFLAKLFGPKISVYTIDCLTPCGTPHRVIVKAISEGEALKFVMAASYTAMGILTQNELVIDEKFHKSEHIVVELN